MPRWFWCALVPIGISLFVSCVEDDPAPPRDAGSMLLNDADPVVTAEAGPLPAADAGSMLALDSSVALALDSGPGRPLDDASSDAAPDAALDAGPLGDGTTDALAPRAVTPREVVEILGRRCGGGCHQHQGSDGFVFDGRLRTTLLARVEAAPTPAGDPSGAAVCRTEPRIAPGDTNSYLLRKLELALGRSPSPPVCGMAMPFGLVLDEDGRRELAVEYERLKLWIAEGAPLE
jgi:hypothetical protein